MHEQNLLNKEYFKINSPKHKISVVISLITLYLVTFVCGIFTANTEWFKSKYNIELQQTESLKDNLEIESLKPYNKALFKKAQSQYEMNIASQERYKHYHEYYKKVAQRIRNFDYSDDTVKTAIISYLDGYENRKSEMDYVMFPCMDKSIEDCGYGTMLGSVYPSAMLEFDRQELLTYRMILTNMYGYISIQDINAFFEE